MEVPIEGVPLGVRRIPFFYATTPAPELGASIQSVSVDEEIFAPAEPTDVELLKRRLRSLGHVIDRALDLGTVLPE